MCHGVLLLQVRSIILDSMADEGWWRLAFLAVTLVWVLWLTFLRNCVVGNLRLMLGPVAQVKPCPCTVPATTPSLLSVS